MTLFYDGSFEGFLSLVHDVYYKRIHVKEIVKEMPHSLFSNEIMLINSDPSRSEKVHKSLKKKFLIDDYKRIHHIFLCDSVSFEKPLLDYIILGFRSPEILRNITHPSLFFIERLERDLLSAVHKMYGFIRFQELEEGSFYAKVETKYNLIPFLAKHFSLRMNGESFIIHDIQRELAFFHTKEVQGIQKVGEHYAPTLSQKEEKYTRLWKSFFDTVSIESRKNPKQQQQFVPLIYRTFMTEFMGNKEDKLT